MFEDVINNNYISQISITTHKSRKQNHNHEILSENKKTHTFFWKIVVEMMKKMVDLWDKHGESVRETNEEDNE